MNGADLAVLRNTTVTKNEPSKAIGELSHLITEI